jgi:hypothetical protein
VICDEAGGSLISTCSALRPGGHQAYSSSAQPESSSLVDERECCGAADGGGGTGGGCEIILRAAQGTDDEINGASTRFLDRTVHECIQGIIDSNSSCLSMCMSRLSSSNQKGKR